MATSQDMTTHPTPAIATPFASAPSNTLGEAEMDLVNNVHSLLTGFLVKSKHDNAPAHVAGNVLATVASTALGMIVQAYAPGAPALFTLLSGITDVAMGYASKNQAPAPHPQAANEPAQEEPAPQAG